MNIAYPMIFTRRIVLVVLWVGLRCHSPGRMGQPILPILRGGEALRKWISDCVGVRAACEARPRLHARSASAVRHSGGALSGPVWFPTGVSPITVSLGQSRHHALARRLIQTPYRSSEAHTCRPPVSGGTPVLPVCPPLMLSLRDAEVGWGGSVG